MFHDIEKRIWLSEWLSKTKQLETVIEYFRANTSRFVHSDYRSLTYEGSPVYKQILELAKLVFPDHEKYFTQQAEYDYPSDIKEEHINVVFDYIERLMKVVRKREGLGNQIQKFKNESEALRRKCEELGNQNKLLTQQLALLQKSHEKILKMAPLASLTKLLDEVRPLLGIGENWAICTCALALSDIAVAKKLEELGEYSGDSFEARYRRLIEAVKRKEGRNVEAPTQAVP